MQLLKQSTAATVLVGPVLDSDGAAYTGMAIGDFNITKNGTTAAMAASATATHSHNGMYLIALTTGNTDTLGRLAISCNKSTYAMTNHRFEVLISAAFDAIVTNGDIGYVPDRTGYLLAILAGAISDASTALETYVITLNGSTFTADYTGLDATGNRTTTTLTKS